MIIFDKKPRLLYILSVVSFVGLYLLIDYTITKESAASLNRTMASWPLFGAIWYHIQHHDLIERPIMILSVLPYFVTIIGYIISIPMLNRYYKVPGASAVKIHGGNANSFLSLLVLIAIVLEIFFDFPLLKLVAGETRQYSAMFALPYGVLNVLTFQIILVGTSGLTK